MTGAKKKKLFDAKKIFLKLQKLKVCDQLWK